MSTAIGNTGTCRILNAANISPNKSSMHRCANKVSAARQAIYKNTMKQISGDLVQEHNKIVRVYKSRLLPFSFYISGFISIWSSTLPMGVFIELQEIRHVVCLGFQQTRRKGTRGRTMQVC